MSVEIFRPEAVQAMVSPDAGDGGLLRISPAWTRWTYRMLAALCVAALVYGAVATLSEYASGPAVVRVDGRTEVTTPTGGLVMAIDVQPGQHVVAGQTLARFYVGQELAERDRLAREFDLELLRLLRDPSDQVSRQTLSSLRAQKELAEARLAERTVRAPQASIVSDIRIHAGQLLAPGELVCSLIGEHAAFSVTALMPGHYRPMLRRGMAMRVELTGFQYAYQNLVVDSVGDEVVGPAEVRRFLGQELGDAISYNGPLVLVRAHLPSTDFVSDTRRFNYYSGIPARADVRVRRQTILVALIPGLRSLFRTHP